MPAATPTEEVVLDDRQRGTPGQQDTPGQSPRQHEVPDGLARRADAAAGREGSLSAERSSDKKVGCEAATVLHARLLPSDRLIASCLEAAAAKGMAQWHHVGQHQL